MTEGKYNVLYVDDEESNLRIFRIAFRKYYNIFTALSAKEALEILDNNEIQLVITDQRMPYMTGVEFLQKIIAPYPDTIRIILTAFSDVEDITQALNSCGVYRYLVKPWNRDEMKLTLDKALESYQLKKDNESLVRQLIEVNAQLEEKVEIRTKELQKAKEKAEEATKVKSSFLSTMSHEIRTPLNAIIGTANLLKGAPLAPEYKENVSILNFSANHLLALINDILDFSKLEAGKIELEDTTFVPREVFDGIFNSLLPQAKDKSLEFNLSYQSEIPRILKGDPVRLGQIFTNIVSNAIKFTSKGSISVEIKTEELNPTHTLLSCKVSDTGIGISKEQIDKIFDDFSQASTDTTRRFGGTGLGLFISKKIIELLDGEINVESQIGEGSTFAFNIGFKKVIKPHLYLHGNKEAKVSKDLKQVNVLIAEDNPMNQAVARKFLKQWNAKFEMANNGLEAVEKVRSKNFQLVLMDIQMPEMDGYEAATQIRKNADNYYQELPIIALTASTLQADRAKVFEAGMNDYVTKPFDPQNLYNIIAQHIGL